MRVFDFDKTVFDGDAERYFFRWLFSDGSVYLTGQRAFYKANYAWHEYLCRHQRITKTKAREADYRILTAVKDIDNTLERFWDAHETYMMDWYLAIKQPDDVIATGTPGFLMVPIMKRLGLSKLVATEMDKHSGKITDKFLGGHLKVPAFRKQFPDAQIDVFYSDTYSDHFLADIAKEAYIIRGDGVQTEWNAYFAAHPEEMTIQYRYE